MFWSCVQSVLRQQWRLLWSAMCSKDSAAAAVRTGHLSQSGGQAELISYPSACVQIYCRPTYEFVEVRFMDITQSAMSRRNVIVRFILTLIYIVIITTLCCMLPFFADFVALCGAIGFTPLVRLNDLGLHPALCSALYPGPTSSLRVLAGVTGSCHSACACA